MAFDGITVNCLVNEFKEKLVDGRIYKIAQPEKDELLLTIKQSKEQNNEQFKLSISANATLPLIYITDTNKTSPLTAPNFCMLLRKHINNGKILDIYQPEMERIIVFVIEHRNELGDLCKKNLIIELMGKHSNIIFTDEKMMILDAIKHVSPVMSSVRTVMPGKEYFIPKTTEKSNPLEADFNTFYNHIHNKNMSVAKSIYSSFTGLSPLISEEICNLASMDSTVFPAQFDEDMLLHLYHMFDITMDKVRNREFKPVIYFENNEPKDYNAFDLSIFSNCTAKEISSISCLLKEFYEEKEKFTRIRQKSADLRKIVTTILEKDYKKYELQLKQIKDTKKMDKYKLYGELLTAYSHNVEAGAKNFKTINYYDGTEITIPLDENKTAMENATKYYARYNKLKRTAAALDDIIKDTKESIDYLENVSVSIDIAQSEDDLKAIKEELISSGYIKKKSGDKKSKFVSKPLHYQTPDGFDIYVGKNNLQNEEITFKLANSGDWWFHAKGMPGSHVIVKSKDHELPDSVFEAAGRLAAFYSKAKGRNKVEIDYVERKHVKKVTGAKPGFVIYHTNYSLMAEPVIDDLILVK